MKTFIYTCLLFPALLFGQWVDRSTPQLGSAYFIYFINDSVGYKGGTVPGGVHKTVNGGWDWTQDTTMYALFKKAVFIDDNIGVAVGWKDAYQTADGGQNWQIISDTFAISDFYNLEERNGTIILNGEDDGEYYWYVFDSPSGWTMRHSTTTESPEICFILDENHFYGVHEDFERIFYTSDGGFTWQIDSQPMVHTYPVVKGLYFTSPDTGFVVFDNKMGFTSTVVRSYTGTEGLLNYDGLTKVHLLHPTNFIGGYGDVVCAGGGDGKFHCTPDLGDHWFEQQLTSNPDYSKNLWDIVFISDEQIVTGGLSDRLFVTNTGIQHSLQTESHIREQDVSVYPNPSNGTFHIEFPSYEGSQWIVTLISAAGQTVHQQVINNATETIQAKHLAKGVYTLRLSSMQGSVSKRLVLQ